MKIQTHGNEHTIFLRTSFDPADTVTRPDLKDADPRGFVILVNVHDPDTGTYTYDTDTDSRLADDPQFKADIEAELAAHVSKDFAVREYQKAERKTFVTADVEAKDNRIAELERQIEEMQGRKATPAPVNEKTLPATPASGQKEKDK